MNRVGDTKRIKGEGRELGRERRRRKNKSCFKFERGKRERELGVPLFFLNSIGTYTGPAWAGMMGVGPALVG